MILNLFLNKKEATPTLSKKIYISLIYATLVMVNSNAFAMINCNEDDSFGRNTTFMHPDKAENKKPSSLPSIVLSTIDLPNNSSILCQEYIRLILKML